MEHINEREQLIWMAGLLEGEGSFMKGPPSNPRKPVISFATTDEDVAHYVASLLGRKPCMVKKRKEHWKQSWLVRVNGKQAVEWMKRLHPFMSTRRKQQIATAIDSYETLPATGGKKRLTHNQVRDIRKKISEGQEGIRAIAREYGVPHTMIMRIRDRQIYAYVE